MKLREPAEVAFLVSAIVILASGCGDTAQTKTKDNSSSSIIMKQTTQKYLPFYSDRFGRPKQESRQPEAAPTALSSQNDSIWEGPGSQPANKGSLAAVASASGAQSASLREAHRMRLRRANWTPLVSKSSSLNFNGHDEDTTLPEETFIEVSPDVQTHLSSQRHPGSRLELLPGLKRSSLEDTSSYNNNNNNNNNNNELPGEGAGEPIRRKSSAHKEASGVQLQLQLKRDQSTSSFPVGRGGDGGGGGGATYGSRQHSAQADRHRDQTNFLQSQTDFNGPTDISTDYLSKMYIDNTIPLEVQSHVGSTAYLVCRLRSIQQQLHLRVSWVRNMQILTSGELRYTSDERFKPTHLAGTYDWVLEIHNVNANDEGSYECQVNSEPKAASVSLYLHVIAVTLEIAEGREVQVGEEEQIKLTCRVEFQTDARPIKQLNEPRSVDSDSSESLQELQQQQQRSALRPIGGFSSQHYIYWYKDNVSLEYNNPRGGIKVELRENASNLEKGLTIEGAQISDSGNYVCKLLPELNEVPAAQAQLTVGGPSSSSSSSPASNGCDCLGFSQTQAAHSMESLRRLLQTIGLSLAAIVAMLLVDGVAAANVVVVL